MTSVTHVFNQYYWDLLKKVKDIARDMKHNADSDTTARAILREIKKSYMSFDKSSEDHIEWYREHFLSVWESVVADKTTLKDVKDWQNAPELASNEVFQGITFSMISSCFKKKQVLLYYLLLLSVFANTSLAPEHVSPILDALKNRADASEISDVPAVKAALALLYEIVQNPEHESKDASSHPERLMNELENTSLGKLAKEIMDDVNVQDIQNSIGDDGDIMKAFADPNGGLSKLIGTVSQKMISKLATGELKQDTLLSDAMKLAGSLGGSAGGAMGNMGSLFENFGKMFAGGADADGDGFDLASMMKNMMSGGMSGGMPGGMPGGAPGRSGRSGGQQTRTTVNSTALTRNVRAKQMRKKLDERRKAKENIGSQVGDDK